ncbi:MAG: M28 family metallopeptidase, partial [Gemmatimonadota bacterium]
LVHESMRGRATTSPEMERTANYVTARLHDAGARPFGDAGGWIQRFDILTTRFDTARAGLEVDGERRFALGGELKLLFDHGIRWEPATGETVVVHGALSDPSDVDPFALDGAIVLLVHPAGPDGDFAPGLGEILNPVMVRPDPPAVIIVSERSAAHRARADTILGTVRSENGWTSPRALNHGVFELHADDVRPLLARRAFDLDDAFASADEPVRATRLPGLDLRLPMPRQVLERRSAPNVVGLIEGSDPEFRDEYVVVLAHMDHIGVGEPDASGDSIYNGADDNASGTAALIEIARAIGAMPRAPARSVIFLATGGEEQGLQGGDYFTLHPPAPLERMGAAVNLDGIGGFWMPDTVAVIGRDDFPRLGALVDRVAARHPELGLSPVGNVLPELNYTFADQVNFARRGVPSIFFSSSGPQDHFHRPGDEPEVVDPDALERITRLVLHTVVAIADRAEGFERDE